MRGILPGKPQSKLQAVSVGHWIRHQIIAYISGNALIILDSPRSLLQTIYLEDKRELETVQVDDESGRIATCARSTGYIYKPYGQDEGALKWSLHCTIQLEDVVHSITTLSWGLPGELLVGSSHLALYDVNAGAEVLWKQELAVTAKLAKFSYDSSLIASVGRHDRMLKVWRRLSFGTDNVQFDFTYLPHATTIVSIHWRRPFHREQLIDNVLYTVCADQKLRVWALLNPHGLQTLQLWREINLLDEKIHKCLKPADDSRIRHTFIIDSCEFTAATERAVQLAKNDRKEQQTLAHLIELAHRNPEVIVILDDHGLMSAWGLENVGCRNRRSSDIYNIVFGVETGLSSINKFDSYSNIYQSYIVCGANWCTGFTILAHRYYGTIDLYEARLDHLFDPLPRQDRIILNHSWTGHSSSISKISRTASGQAMISRTTNNESIIWRQAVHQSNAILSCQSMVKTDEEIHKTCLLQEGDFAVLLHDNALSLWDTRSSQAMEVCRCSFQIAGKPLCLILLPEASIATGSVHIATITTKMKGAVWEVQLPGNAGYRINDMNVNISGHIDEFANFDLGRGDDLLYLLPVDPAGSRSVEPGFLDSFAGDVIIGFTSTGLLNSWTAKIDVESKIIQWLLTSSVETGFINPSLASGSSIRKAAMVDSDSTHLTIWDTRSAILEYDEIFETSGTIQDLDWASTPDNQSILAVGFPYQVVLYAQLRFDYLDAGPSWRSIRQISIRDLTPHPIGDSVWLGSGNLVMCAGNQLFVEDDFIEVSESIANLRLAPRDNSFQNVFSLVSWLNGPLPIFHPQFIAQAVLAGKLQLVQQILFRLYRQLRNLSNDKLDSMLGFSVTDFFAENNDIFNISIKKSFSLDHDYHYDDKLPPTFSEEVAVSLKDILTSTQISQLSSFEQFRLADIIECVGTVEKHRRSLDPNGCRFLVFFRQHLIRNSRQAMTEHYPISWREIVWAYHSGSQDILADLVSRHYQGRMLWVHARESGLFMWMGNLSSLHSQFESIARNEYTKSEEKNPIDCSLYYIAMRKKSVLLRLWRMATWHPEQRLTLRLLANNFEESRWKTAALKNAYALMGKRRFEYAAAFFLLAGNLEDCINVLAHQLGDVQLAIAVSRVYEGDNGPVLKEFIENKILPQAVLEGNRWLATWAFWMLFKRDKAVRALVVPLNSLVTPPQSPNLQSKKFLMDDPALVVLYKQLREKSLQTLRGAVMIPPKVETEFVLQTARFYDRMGCDILALDLVRSWEFLKQPTTSPAPLPPLPNKSAMTLPKSIKSPTSPLESTDFDPRKLLRRRSSLVVADLPLTSTSPSPSLSSTGHPPASILEEKHRPFESSSEGQVDSDKENVHSEKKEKKNKPTIFNEPDPNSLLDSFGF